MIFDAFAERLRTGVATAVERTTAHDTFSVWSENAGGERSGGDWCIIVPLSEHFVALSIGDVAGHGRAATGTMAIVRASILAAIEETRVPSEMFRAANAIAFREGLLVTAIAAIFDRRRRTLTFANAGHPPPLVSTGAAHAFVAHPPADLPLGVYARHDAANYVVALPKDALFLLYTDGITEHARDPIRGEAELVEAARWSYERPERDPAQAVADRMLRLVRGGDDAAVMALRLAGAF
jgi:serine phosphatase RsbU (regulator of sigma subunit)